MRTDEVFAVPEPPISKIDLLQSELFG